MSRLPVSPASEISNFKFFYPLLARYFWGTTIAFLPANKLRKSQGAPILRASEISNLKFWILHSFSPGIFGA
jgi:hypothetical protein